MKKYFKSLTELEDMGFLIIDHKGVAKVKAQLNEKVPVFVTDDDMRIENEGGTHIANVQAVYLL